LIWFYGIAQLVVPVELPQLHGHQYAVSSFADSPIWFPFLAFVLTGDLQTMPSRCQFHGCKKKPYYGVEGDKPKFRYCAEHKLDGMTNLKTSRCEGEDCRKVCLQRMMI
jgi:EsV-1-7 cysteine-rich motif